MVKVSVVVPTYCSGDGLDRLIASLDGQTMPASEFEVIFVDDGSPDDTFDRLQRIAATRPHVRLERIENSGWPCRPRNIGTDLARGEYVAYMDHDDLLYPDALRAAYDFAIACGADVVNGKEARTHDATWAIDTYRADEAQSLGRTDQHPLIPMNPHKLYRRAFLDEHGIRFREGGRVLWEDIFFNLLVARHARVISTMASTPYYYWHTTAGSGSHGFLRSTPPFWEWLREVLVATRDDLAGEAFDLPRAQLVAHQYRSRVLASFDKGFAARPPADRELIYQACRTLQSDFDLWEHDARLSRSQAIRARLLRADERSLLEGLSEHDPVIPGRVTVTSMSWVGGRLEIEAEAVWASASGRRHALRGDDAAIRKDLPDSYAGVLPASLCDVTQEIHAAIAELGVRSRESRVTWMLPGTQAVTVVAAEGRVSFGVLVESILDPDTAVFGRALEPGLWDVNARCVLGSDVHQEPMRCELAPAAVLIGDELRLAYENVDGFLTVSIGPPWGDALRHLTPDASGVTVRSNADGTLRVRIPLPEIQVARDGSVDALVGTAEPRGVVARAVDRRRRDDFRPTAAHIVSEGGVAAVVLTLPADSRPLRVGVGDRRRGGVGWWLLDVRDPRAPRLTPQGRPRPGGSRPSLLRRLRRRVGRIVRRR